MKNNARSYFWWPSLDREIESKANNCKICVYFRPDPQKATNIPIANANYVYERIHADFLGPFKGKTILVISDLYSKWLEAFIVNNTSAETVIEIFRQCFARFGVPRIVHTDHGPPFNSSEFSNFLSNNGTKFLTSPPYHPATNGFCENSVKNIKNGLLKALRDEQNENVKFETLLNRFLFHYRNSIHVTTGVSPSSLMFKHKVKTRFDLLCNNVSQNVKNCKNGRDIFSR